jgi:gluconolactonase
LFFFEKKNQKTFTTFYGRCGSAGASRQAREGMHGMTNVRDARLAQVIAPEATIEAIVTGLTITEGTIWHPRDNYLIFSDLGTGTIHRWTQAEGASVIRKPSNIANGNYVDRQGRLVTCEHSTNCVSRIETDARCIRVLASHYAGKEFNSPNDVIVDSCDRIWFTDPDYGRTSPRVGVARPLELGFNGVFRLDPDGTVSLVADDFIQPNGLCLTPDERVLLVNDTTRSHIRRFDVGPDGQVSGGDVLATITGEGVGKPDGMKVDVEGRIYVTGPGGIHVLTPAGDLLGVIWTPALTRNFCFGGANFRTLYLAVDRAICRVPMKVAGVAPPME